MKPLRVSSWLVIGIICFLWYPLLGWGFNAHRIINQKAVTLLPAPLDVYFFQHIDEISVHAIDPDLWREDPEHHPNEGPGHYIDIDLYDHFPFSHVPYSFSDLIDKYGEETVNKWGFAPWRIEKVFQTLVTQFRNKSWDEIPLTASVLGHYIADIHMPLHVVENYNGQFSGNLGVHMRWESEMVDEYILSQIEPNGEVISIQDPVTETFTIIKESYQLYTQILKADSLARKNLSVVQRRNIANVDVSMVGTSYLEILYQESGRLAKDRLEKAAVMVASFWYSAWLEAGKPELPQNNSK